MGSRLLWHFSLRAGLRVWKVGLPPLVYAQGCGACHQRYTEDNNAFTYTTIAVIVTNVVQTKMAARHLMIAVYYGFTCAIGLVRKPFNGDLVFRLAIMG